MFWGEKALEARDFRGPAGFAGFVHDHVAFTIGQLDTKVSIIMGFTAAAIAYDVQQLSAMAHVTAIFDPTFLAQLTAEPLNPRAWQSIFGFLSTAMLAIAFLCAVVSLSPRSGPVKKGVVFFQGIAAHETADEYASEATHIADTDLTKAVLIDAYALSKIAQTKARWAGRTTPAFIWGLLFLLLTQLAAGMPAQAAAASL